MKFVRLPLVTPGGDGPPYALVNPERVGLIESDGEKCSVVVISGRGDIRVPMVPNAVVEALSEAKR